MSCATTLRGLPAVWGAWRVANMGKLYHVATDAVEETIQIIRRNPFASIAVGLGVGFLFGLIPTGGHARRAYYCPFSHAGQRVNGRYRWQRK